MKFVLMSAVPVIGVLWYDQQALTCSVQDGQGRSTEPAGGHYRPGQALDSRNTADRPVVACSDSFQQEPAELDTGQDCCPVPAGQEPEQDRQGRPVVGLSVSVSGTGLSIQAWTDGTRGWWHILPSLEIHERAQSLDTACSDDLDDVGQTSCYPPAGRLWWPFRHRQGRL